MMWWIGRRPYEGGTYSMTSSQEYDEDGTVRGGLCRFGTMMTLSLNTSASIIRIKKSCSRP